MTQNTRWEAVAGALLVFALGIRPALGANVDPKDVQYVNDVLGTAAKSPETGKALMSHMSQTKQTAESIAAGRVTSPTPANVQQYSGKAQEVAPDKTLSTCADAARSVLVKAGAIAVSAKNSAKDAPRKYVAETGGKVVTLLDDTYNESAMAVQEQVNTVRAELEEMVAIALIINGAGGGNGDKNKASAAGKNTKAATENKEGGGRAPQGKSTFFNAADAEIGRAAVALVAPELPISKRGQMLFEDASNRVKNVIPALVDARAANVVKARQLTKELASKEAAYHQGMKGAGGAEGTSQVLATAADSLDAYLAMIKSISGKLAAFVDGPGRAIYDVVHSDQAVYDAGVALQQDIPFERQLALSQEALDSNLKAARGVGPMAREFRGLLDWMGSKVAAEKITPPSFASMGAPKAGASPNVPTTGVNAARREAGKL